MSGGGAILHPMNLSVRFGEAEIENLPGGKMRIIGVDGDMLVPVVFARSCGYTINFNPAVQCSVEFEPDEVGTHTLAASMRNEQGKLIGQEQRKEFEPPEYGVFPYMFWWPNATLYSGQYLAHVSLDGGQIWTKTLTVLPQEMNPQRAR